MGVVLQASSLTSSCTHPRPLLTNGHGLMLFLRRLPARPVQLQPSKPPGHRARDAKADENIQNLGGNLRVLMPVVPVLVECCTPASWNPARERPHRDLFSGEFHSQRGPDREQIRRRGGYVGTSCSILVASSTAILPVEATHRRHEDGNLDFLGAFGLDLPCRRQEGR